MASTYVTARVIKHNNTVFLTEDQNSTVGTIMAVPTPGAGARVDGDYWAIPINDNGIVTGFDFEPTTPTSTDAPTADSFHVTRITNMLGYDVWWILGTSTFDGESPANPGYIQAAQDVECCEADPRLLPTDAPTVYPCQVSCILTDGAPGYQFNLQLPLPRSGANFTGNGYLNGTALPQVQAATPALLQTALNSNWTNVGSPNVVVTWTVSADGQIIGTVTDGDGSETLCARFL
jgi:hypothetical protein